MRLAVISDIHGNLEAFRQVLLDIQQSVVDAVVCLGDCIGYGPEPERVVDLIRGENIPCVMGNHELGLVNRSYLTWFNAPTRQSLLLTQELVSRETLEFIKGLKPAIPYQGCLCVHGCPPDSITTYMFNVLEKELVRIFKTVQEQICFVGHTHTLELIGFDGNEIHRTAALQGVHSLKADRQYIVNVGSVGQPRDGNNRAKYVIWDSSRQTIEVRYVPYDISITARKILDLGFPRWNAQRLW